MYVVPPTPVNVALFPKQTAVKLLEAVMVGKGFTIKLTVFVSEQLLVLPTTVYVVFTIGLTVTLAPDKFPGFQV